MKKTRKILKGYFRSKSIPTSVQYADFIDSVPNILEDRCIRNGENGVVLYPNGKDNTILEIYPQNVDESSVEKPCWSLVMDENKNLRLLNANRMTVFSTEIEQKRLQGDFFKDKTDREWKFLPIESKGGIERKPGCRAYRIFAYYKLPDSKKYAFIEVIASHRNGRKFRLSSPSKFFGIWFSKILFRWRFNDGEISLVMRSRKAYPEIDVHIQIFELYEFIDD